jgi:hypothetical protein
MIRAVESRLPLERSATDAVIFFHHQGQVVYSNHPAQANTSCRRILSHTRSHFYTRGSRGDVGYHQKQINTFYCQYYSWGLNRNSLLFARWLTLNCLVESMLLILLVFSVVFVFIQRLSVHDVVCLVRS